MVRLGDAICTSGWNSDQKPLKILLPSSFFRHILGILVIHWIFWAPAFYGQKNWFFMNSEQNSDQKSSWTQLESSGILIWKADVCIYNLNLKFHMIFWCNNYIRKNILNLQLCCQWKVQDQILPFANLNLSAISVRKLETDGGWWEHLIWIMRLGLLFHIHNCSSHSNRHWHHLDFD